MDIADAADHLLIFVDEAARCGLAHSTQSQDSETSRGFSAHAHAYERISVLHAPRAVEQRRACVVGRAEKRWCVCNASNQRASNRMRACSIK